jgi:Ku protein
LNQLRTFRLRLATSLSALTGVRPKEIYEWACRPPVDDEDQVKGNERKDGEYVMLEDEELQAVALESTRTIDIDHFVPAGSIGWIWYDTPHYLIPDDKAGEEAFSVIREAMVRSDTRAISRVVLNHRERAVRRCRSGRRPECGAHVAGGCDCEAQGRMTTAGQHLKQPRQK